MPHKIEEDGILFLISRLVASGHKVERTKGTFYLLVDGAPAEVKTKRNGLNKLDFISLTEKQFQALLTPRVITSYEYDKKKLLGVLASI